MRPAKKVILDNVTFHIGRLPADVGSRLLNRFIDQILERVSQPPASDDSAPAQEPTPFEDLSPEEQAKLTAERERMAEAVTNLAVRGLLTKLSQTEYSEVMRSCLMVCSREEENMPVPTPVMNDVGAWVIRELEWDSMTVLALVTRTLVFNMGPIFAAGQKSNL